MKSETIAVVATFVVGSGPLPSPMTTPLRLIRTAGKSVPAGGGVPVPSRCWRRPRLSTVREEGCLGSQGRQRLDMGILLSPSPSPLFAQALNIGFVPFFLRQWLVFFQAILLHRFTKVGHAMANDVRWRYNDIPRPLRQLAGGVCGCRPTGIHLAHLQGVT